MANLTYVELITPERVLFSGEAEAVVMRTDGGDITFLANHMDYIAAVDICVVRIEGVQSGGSLTEGVTPREAESRGEAASEPAGSGEVVAAVHGGFVKVAANKVTVISGVAELAEEIDVSRAKRALEAAEAGGTARGPGGPGGEALAGTDDPAQLAEAASVDAAALAAVSRARVRLAAAGELEGDLSHL
ncbi:MAG: F0F1 ATP synthase subunit epsilon [Acidimicrobiales bacterium]